MHELSIAVAVVEQVEEAVRDRGRAVASLTLRIGELAGVVPEALEFSFGLAAEGTALAGARLLIETVEARGRCEGCGREAATGMPPVLWCAGCGAPLTLLGGRELEIVRLTLAEGPAEEPRSAPPGPPVRDEEASHVPHR
ncbi:hydrogenase maturation nickel metallochaperone HypA/HybF [Streptomyces aureus]|uniref:hydrogenase maturation nickel metallochaperone HypA/HybF n=1 Tax=Streptomyces aureus TaxID=193461 RepID=UPI000565E860|nr:hydrogenase maturation nickel metallochaperone HypA [Streptomyces aureus]